MLRAAIIAFSLVALPLSASPTFNALLERFIDVRNSPGTPEQVLETARAIEQDLNALKEQTKNPSRLANIDFMLTTLLLVALEQEAKIQNLTIMAPEFEKVRRRIMAEYETNCKTSGHQTSCTNFYYLKKKGPQFKMLRDEELDDFAATQILAYAKGRRSPHFLHTVSGLLKCDGCGVKTNAALAAKIDHLSRSRAPFMLIGRAFDFSERDDFKAHFAPWLGYQKQCDMPALTEELLSSINTSNTRLITEIRELAKVPETRALLIEFYKECVLSTTNLKRPRNSTPTQRGWPSSEGDFAWKSVMDEALDEEAKAQGAAEAEKELARLVALEGSSRGEINSARADMRSRCTWTADDADFERLAQGTEFVQ